MLVLIVVAADCADKVRGKSGSFGRGVATSTLSCLHRAEPSRTGCGAAVLNSSLRRPLRKWTLATAHQCNLLPHSPPTLTSLASRIGMANKAPKAARPASFDELCDIAKKVVDVFAKHDLACSLTGDLACALQGVPRRSYVRSVCTYAGTIRHADHSCCDLRTSS